MVAAGRPYRLHVVRFLPGEEVRTELEQFCVQEGLEAAAIVSAVGSVSSALIRFGGRPEGTAISGDLEVCTLSGTLSKHGMHIHLAVADGDGRMTGGHLMKATVRTTLEVVIQEVGGVRMVRRKDERTGYNELFPEVISP